MLFLKKMWCKLINFQSLLTVGRVNLVTLFCKKNPEASWIQQFFSEKKNKANVPRFPGLQLNNLRFIQFWLD